jgi:hypothetical protein
MRTLINFALVVSLNMPLFISCTKTIPVTTEEYDLLLSYLSASSPGSLTTVIATIDGHFGYPALVKWYADDYPFPQSLREQDILNHPADAAYLFSFPFLPDKACYYIRCSVSMEDGVILEKTARIETMR